MGALRNTTSAVEQSAPDDDADVYDVLTPKQEAFAQLWAKTGNKAAAYRGAYNVHPLTLPNVVWVSASRVAGLPKVEARYKVLNEQAALETIMSVRELYQLAVDIASADPTELVKTVARNCRHCRGHDYKYQWKDGDEYTAACVEALDKGTMPPLDDGGYGFNGALEPIATCAHCYGVGHEHTVITPTDKLVGRARRLYAGAKQDRFGCIEIKMHDQKAYHEMACRMVGAFNDSLDIRTPEQRAEAELRKKLPENVTAEGAAKAYLQLIN